jgi:hypothetical protein
MSSTDPGNVDTIFFTKYNEFCEELKGVFPEATAAIDVAKALSDEEKKAKFRQYVLPKAGNPKRNPKHNPGCVLPGVTFTDEQWYEFSANTKKAIQEYLTLLSFCLMFGTEGMNAQWAEDALKQIKEKLNTADFKSLSDKIMNLMSSGKFNALPERLLKGQIAKLAEELVKEFRPEDFGLNESELQSLGDNPTRVFELLSQIYTRNPNMLQNVMKRITKRLQEKVQRGELRPREIAAEAEELIKEFTENPEMKELMESFRTMFGYEDEEASRAVGRDGNSRLAIAQKRLRKKLEAKKGQK